MGYVIANKYNVILVCLSLAQNMTMLPLRSTPPSDIRQHRMINIGHVNGSHFVQVDKEPWTRHQVSHPSHQL